jgi:hypothetical protein
MRSDLKILGKGEQAEITLYLQKNLKSRALKAASTKGSTLSEYIESLLLVELSAINFTVANREQPETDLPIQSSQSVAKGKS